MIPRIVHQIWLGADRPAPPPHMAEASRTWAERNPGWTHRLWGATDVERLFDAARADLLPLYRAYPHWIFRADAARYLILHEHGGVYADMDIACAGPLDPFEEDHLVLAPTWPFGLSNDLMMASPRHPFFRSLLDGLPAAFRRWDHVWVPPFVRVLSGGGSTYLSAAWKRRAPETAARLLTAEEYGHAGPERAIARHLPGSTWHRWDARLVREVWRRRRWILAGAALAGAAAFARP